LEDFINDPTQKTNFDHLCCIPSLFWLLNYERKQQPYWDNSILGVCSWMNKRCKGLMEKIIKYPCPKIIDNIEKTEGGWQKVFFIL